MEEIKEEIKEGIKIEPELTEKPKKPKKPKKAKPATMDDVLGAINGLTQAITKLVTPVLAVEREDVANTPTQPVVTVESGFPIPFEYTEILHTILNKNFGLEMKYLPESASFEFAVLVPQAYSNAGEPHWNAYHEDRRSKVIENVYGSNGVREWVTHIYENFNPETRSRITYDRAQIS